MIWILIGAGVVAILVVLYIIGKRDEEREAAEGISPQRRSELEQELSYVRDRLREAGVPEEEMPAAGGRFQVVQMEVKGRVYILEDGVEVAMEPLPAFEHGEMPKAVWGGQRHLYVVGYQYTGDSREDTGVIYHRTPDGQWQVEWREEEKPVVGVWGTGPDNVFAVGRGGVVHWDGRRWSKRPIDLQPGEVLLAVWGNALGDVYATSGQGRVFRSRAGGAFAVEAELGVALYGLGGAGRTFWAAGDGGSIFRTDGDGRWSREPAPTRAQLVSVCALGPDEAYVAGGQALLRSDGDGVWDELPRAPQWARCVVDDGEGGILVGTGGALARFGGEAWQTLDWKGSVSGLSVEGDRIYVVAEKITEL
jgi:hypothetical protein